MSINISMHSSNLTRRSNNALVDLSDLKSAFNAGANGGELNVPSGFWEKVKEFFSGKKVQKEAAEIMYKIGEQYRSFKNPRANAADKNTAMENALQGLVTLKGMVNEGNIADFDVAMAPLVHAFAKNMNATETLPEVTQPQSNQLEPRQNGLEREAALRAILEPLESRLNSLENSTSHRSKSQVLSKNGKQQKLEDTPRSGKKQMVRANKPIGPTAAPMGMVLEQGELINPFKLVEESDSSPVSSADDDVQERKWFNKRSADCYKKLASIDPSEYNKKQAAYYEKLVSADNLPKK